MVSVILLLFDLSPKRIENIYKPMIQISVNAGILFIGLISLNDISFFNGKFAGENWNYVHAATAICGAILFLTTLILPESPKYLYLQGRLNDAEAALRTLRGEHYSQDELEALKPSQGETQEGVKMSVMSFLITKRFRFPIISLIMLHIGQQLCGINAIMAFAPSLLRSLKYGRPDICGLAPFVGNQRRKVLWLTGFIFMFISFSSYLISEALNAPEQLKLFWLCLFVFMFQIGPGIVNCNYILGPVAWFISVEMFPAEASGAAQGVASFFNWFANTLVFLLFPIALASIGINTLYIFITFQGIIILYSAFFVIETRNKTPQCVIDEYQALSSC
ncbi:LOW QUALITY PROTEIN: hypothetical protein MXB_1249 [Myxobolus squamalis]|nr:LOW QUALITY PROTEIN: hypothetical protein MXB_1249 [Myxobolus squamalis]